MKEAGEMLKKAREAKNLSLHEIGLSLKINPKTLQAIEEGDMAKLPQKIFLRGFIKSYAQFLKLDVAEVLRASQELTVVNTIATPTMPGATTHAGPETPVTTTPNVNVTPATPKIFAGMDRTARLDNLKTTGPTPRKGLYVIMVVVLLLAVGFVARLVNRYQRERPVQKPVEEIAKDVAVPVPAESNELAKIAEASSSSDAAAKTTSSATVTATANSVSSAASSSSSVPVAKAKEETKSTAPIMDNKSLSILSPVLPTAPIVTSKPAVAAAPSAATKSTSSAPSTVATTSSAASAATSSAVSSAKKEKPKKVMTPEELANAKPQEVIIEALNKVQIQYTLEDNSVATIQLNPEEIHTFKGKFINLEISDGGSVSVITNGRERGIPGKIGKPVTLHYPK